MEYHKNLRGNREIKNENDTYYFFEIGPSRGRLIAKGVILGISESEGTYVGNLFNVDKTLEHGIAGLADENYEFSTQLLSLYLPKEIAASLKERGSLLPRCVLVKQYKKVDLYNRKQIKFISYWENAANSGYACNRWKDKASLVEEQKTYLAEFSKRASGAFTVGNTLK